MNKHYTKQPMSRSQDCILNFKKKRTFGLRSWIITFFSKTSLEIFGFYEPRDLIKVVVLNKHVKYKTQGCPIAQSQTNFMTQHYQLHSPFVTHLYRFLISSSNIIKSMIEFVTLSMTKLNQEINNKNLFKSKNL